MSTSNKSPPVTTNREQNDFILTISLPKNRICLPKIVKRIGALNNQSQQEDANTSHRKTEVIYLDSPQVKSTDTTIDLTTPGTQENTDQGGNDTQTDSPAQPKHTEKTNNNDAHTRTISSHPNNRTNKHKPKTSND